MGTLNNIKRWAPVAGRLIPIKMNMYPGAPTLHVEFLGESNSSLMNESARQTEEDATVHAIMQRGPRTAEERERVREKNRLTLSKHGVRKIEGHWYYDGPDGGPDVNQPIPSNAEGIHDIVYALDKYALEYVLTLATNVENYRDTPSPNAFEIAKK